MTTKYWRLTAAIKFIIIWEITACSPIYPDISAILSTSTFNIFPYFFRRIRANLPYYSNYSKHTTIGFFFFFFFFFYFQASLCSNQLFQPKYYVFNATVSIGPSLCSASAAVSARASARACRPMWERKERKERKVERKGSFKKERNGSFKKERKKEKNESFKSVWVNNSSIRDDDRKFKIII